MLITVAISVSQKGIDCTSFKCQTSFLDLMKTLAFFLVILGPMQVLQGSKVIFAVKCANVQWE